MVQAETPTSARATDSDSTGHRDAGTGDASSKALGARAPSGVTIKSYLWDVFVRCVGVNQKKKRVVRQFLSRPGRILEIGCATGNLASAFREFDYVGIDTDRQCIEMAAWRHSGANYNFYCLDVLRDQIPGDVSFDYVLISHTLHHLPDDYARKLLSKGLNLLRPGGTLLVLDMIRPLPSEPFRKQFYYRLDRGEYFRDVAEMRSLFAPIEGLAQIDLHVVKTRKLGIEVIDQVVVQAKAASG